MKVLVVGDVCIDIHVYGECKNLCPDAPVPVFVPIKQKENKGMAGNVYENLLSFGISADLECNSDLITKTRYVEEKRNHMFLRIDSGEEKIKRIDNLSSEKLKEYDAVVVSDYNKGFLLKEDVRFICDNHSLVFLDTKKMIGDFCRNSTFIKINAEEYKKSFEEYENTSKSWAHEKMIVTLGQKGCRYKNHLYEVERVSIKDTSGAGDTFMASFVYKYLKDKDIDSALNFANECATIVVQKKGVNVVKKVER